MRALDLDGQRFGRLVVVGYVRSEKRQRILRCVCDCGREKEAATASLRASHVRSCGCLHPEVRRLARRTHGETVGHKVSPEYGAWAHMIERCTNPNDRFFKDYGGRGITVCAEWRFSFQQFLSDMGRRPTPEHSLERIRVNEDYEPGNCRWATANEQARNTRRSKLIAFRGRQITIGEILEACGYPSSRRNYARLRNRLNALGDPEAAMASLIRDSFLDHAEET